MLIPYTPKAMTNLERYENGLKYSGNKFTSYKYTNRFGRILYLLGPGGHKLNQPVIAPVGNGLAIDIELITH